MLTNKDYENIGKYIEGELSSEARSKFELELSKRPQLSKVLAMSEDMIEGLKDVEGNLDFNKKLKKAAQQYNTNNPKVKPNKPFFLYLILAILIAVVVKLVFFNGGEAKEYKAPITIENAKDPIAVIWKDLEKPSESIKRSKETPTADEITYKKAQDLFLQGAFVDALNTIELLEEDSPIYIDALLLKGVNNYELGNYKEAINAYEIYGTKGELSQDLLLWYLGIAYTKDGQEDKAKEIFQKIIDNDFRMKEEAEWLIKELADVK